MSYGIIRIEKFKSGAVKGLENHDKRLKESISNPDINKSKSEDNYNLIQTDLTYQVAIKNRIKELNLKRAVRKDAVVMCQCLVTSDSEFFENALPGQQEKFFQDSYKFISDRYGENNIISAIVHLDEKTPHMHVNFVPVTKDNRLSAKSLITRTELSKLHDDFYKKVGLGYCLDRGETREDKQKHLSVQEYKKETLKEEIEKLEIQKNKTEKKLSKYVDMAKDMRSDFEYTELNVNYRVSRIDKNEIVMSKDDFERMDARVKESTVFQKEKMDIKSKALELQRAYKYNLQRTKVLESRIDEQGEFIAEQKRKIKELEQTLRGKDLKIDTIKKIIDKLGYTPQIKRIYNKIAQSEEQIKEFTKVELERDNGMELE